MATSSGASINDRCCVPLCTSDGRYDSSLHYHRIPKDPDRRKDWLIKIRRDEGHFFKISSSTKVCSKHFTKEDYTGWSPVRKKLKRRSVPSVFDWTEEKAPRRTLKKKVLSPVKERSDDLQSDTVEEPEDPANDIAEVTENAPALENKHSRIRELEARLQEKADECNDLKVQLSIEKFGVSRFSHGNSLISFYTGFPIITFTSASNQKHKICKVHITKVVIL